MPFGRGPKWKLRDYRDLRTGIAGEAPSDLKALVDAIEALESGAPDLEATRTAHLDAVDQLAARGIQPRRSQLTPIYVDLHRAAASAHRRGGNEFLAHWCELLVADGGEALVADGRAPATDALADRVIPAATEASPLAGATTPDLGALRLRGAHFEVLSLSNSDRPFRGDAQWNAACARMHLTASTDPLRALLDMFDNATSEQRTWAALYAHAEAKKYAADRAKSVAAEQWVGPAATPLEILIAVRDSEAPMHRRLVDIGYAIDRITSAGGDAEARLAFLAGVARWLIQARKMEPVRTVTEAYRLASRRLSAGQNDDVLGFVSDIYDASAQFEMPRSPAAIRTPQSRSARGIATASLLAQLMASLGVSRTRRLFARGERAKRLDTTERRALIDTMIRHADALKGPLLKLGQHLSYAGLELDPALERRLCELQDASTPIGFDVVERALQRELGRPPREIFAEISEAPIGVGSVSQVHAARLPDGTRVAVKVQFPGIRDAIAHDIWNLGLLVPLASILRAKVDWRRIVATVEASLLAECDFAREASIQRAFHHYFADDPIIRVPRVFDSLSTERVLTMELVSGARLNDFVENADYDERRTVANAILRLMFSYVDDVYTFCDPHPGNFLVDDQHLYVLDYGCVGQWDPQVRWRWIRLGRAMVEGDVEELKRGVRELGFPVDAAHFDYDEFVSKFHSEFYTSATDEVGAPVVTSDAVSRQLADFFSSRSSNYHNMQIPPQLVLGLRSYYGTMYVLAQLKMGIDATNPAFQSALQATVAAAREASAVDRPAV